MFGYINNKLYRTCVQNSVAIVPHCDYMEMSACRCCLFPPVTAQLYEVYRSLFVTNSVNALNILACNWWTFWRFRQRSTF